MTQQAEITFEIEETITLRTGQSVQLAICPLCQTVVENASSQFVPAVTQTPIREVFRQVETGNVDDAEDLTSERNTIPSRRKQNEEK